MSPRNRNPNQNPGGPRNQNQGHNPNTLRDQDPAAQLMDPLRELYRYAENNQQRDALFRPDGFDGSYDLLQIADDVRQENRSLDTGEQVLAIYVDLQAQNVTLAAGINFDVLEEDYTTKNGKTLSNEEAAAARISNVVRSISGKINRSNDNTEKTRLTEQRDNLRAYRKLYLDGTNITPGMATTGHEFMEAWRSFRSATDPQARNTAQNEVQQASDNLNKNAETFVTQARAFGALLEHGRPEYLQTPAPADPSTIDPRLEYVAVPGYQPPATGGGNGGGTPPPAGPRRTQPPQPPQQPPRGQGQPGGQPNQNQARQQRLDEVTEELEHIGDALAIEKAKVVRNSKIGRLVLGMLGVSSGRQRVLQLEERYRDLARMRWGLDNHDNLQRVQNGQLDAQEEERLHARIAKDVFDQQEKLRVKTRERMRAKRIAKMSEWVLKHKTVVLGGAAAASFLLTPALLGAGIGLLAAAKHDNATRGLRPFIEKTNRDELLRASLSTRRGNGNGIPRLDTRGVGAAYNAAMRYSMERIDEEVDRELQKRGLSIALGMAAWAGANFTAHQTVSTIENINWDHVVDWMKAHPGPFAPK